MIGKRYFLFPISVLIVLFSSCQLETVSRMLTGSWSESYRASSGETVVLTVTFNEETQTFTWIEKQGDVEKSNRNGSYIIYLNDSVADSSTRGTIVLQFAESADAQAKNIAFWFSFSETDGTTCLNLKPVSESEDTYVLCQNGA